MVEEVRRTHLFTLTTEVISNLKLSKMALSKDPLDCTRHVMGTELQGIKERKEFVGYCLPVGGIDIQVELFEYTAPKNKRRCGMSIYTDSLEEGDDIVKALVGLGDELDYIEQINAVKVVGTFVNLGMSMNDCGPTLILFGANLHYQYNMIMKDLGLGE